MPRLNIVLYEPQIPQNTGNIGRTCVAVGAKLWIVRPTGFRLDATHLKRAGLDYWQHLDWQAVDDWEILGQNLNLEQAWYFTKFSKQCYTDVRFQLGDVLVFGSETNGLPDNLRSKYNNQCVQIPMVGPVRSLNLAVSVGVGVFEAIRQIG